MVDFLNRNAPFFGLFSGEVSSRVSFPFGSADSPSSFVHCAPWWEWLTFWADFNFKLLSHSVYVPLYISELTRT